MHGAVTSFSYSESQLCFSYVLDSSFQEPGRERGGLCGAPHKEPRTTRETWCYIHACMYTGSYHLPCAQGSRQVVDFGSRVVSDWSDLFLCSASGEIITRVPLVQDSGSTDREELASSYAIHAYSRGS